MCLSCAKVSFVGSKPIQPRSGSLASIQACVAFAPDRSWVVSVLAGGYDKKGLKESVAAHVTALMGA